MSAQYLAVDIGGTKTVLALYSVGDLSYTPIVKERYQSSCFDSVETIISDFTNKHSINPGSACLAIAGIVGESEARVTNLPWVISRENLYCLGFSTVSMINDLTAVAASLPLLGADDLLCLQAGDKPHGAVSAVLAPGTGLGEGFILDSGNFFFPRGTEGGHADFAPVNPEQRELLAWLSRNQAQTISYEMVCAGPAIGTLYDFYRAQGEQASGRVFDELSRLTDRTPMIVESGLSGSCPVCRKALDLFLAILGREGANLVMKVYATRGLFLGGGILPRLAGRTSFAPFLNAFHLPGTMAGLLETIPINLILRQDAALLGAASYGSRVLGGLSS